MADLAPRASSGGTDVARELGSLTGRAPRAGQVWRLPTGSTRIVLAATVVCAVATAFVVGMDTIRFAYDKPGLHVLLETLASVVASVGAYLVFGRFRRSGHLDDLLLALSLAVLGLTNLLFAAIPIASLSDSSRFATWMSLGGRITGALIFAAAAVVPCVRLRDHRRALTMAIAAIAGVILALAAAIAALVDRLPAAVELVPTSSPTSPDLAGHPVVLAAQVVTMAAFGVAAVGFAHRAARTGDGFVQWVAVASVFGAFARVHYLLYPSLYSQRVYTGDIFRLLFYLMLCVAAAREIRRYWIGLAGLAVLEERRRIARELHDGVAQELAFILRRSARLARSESGTGEHREIARAAERALDDSRRAIAALTRPGSERLDVALGDAVAQVADRLGANLELELAEHVEVPPATGEALIRIASEAVANAARHAEARTIWVELTGGQRVRLRVRDDGRGFDPDGAAARDAARFGLTTMRERAEQIGAEFRLRSAAGRGTLVEVTLP